MWEHTYQDVHTESSLLSVTRPQAELSGQGALQFWPRSSRKVRVLIWWWWPMLTRGNLGLCWESNMGPGGEPSVVLKQLPELSSLWDYWQAWLVKATLISFRLTGRYWSYYEEVKKEGIPQAPPEFKLWSPSGDYPSLNRRDKRESWPSLWSQF